MARDRQRVKTSECSQHLRRKLNAVDCAEVGRVEMLALILVLLNLVKMEDVLPGRRVSLDLLRRWVDSLKRLAARSSSRAKPSAELPSVSVSAPESEDCRPLA